jgi:hypothetical protein
MASILKCSEFQDLAGVKYGTILQVVSAFDNTHYVFNAGSANQVTYYNITGLSVNITPKSTSSRILLLASVSGGQSSNAYNGYIRLARNGNGIGTSDSRGIYVAGGSAMAGWRTVDNSELAHASLLFVDSPNTTSATTYNVQVCNSGGGSYTTTINRGNATDTSWQQAGSSSIVAMEIQG